MITHCVGAQMIFSWKIAIFTKHICRKNAFVLHFGTLCCLAYGKTAGSWYACFRSVCWDPACLTASGICPCILVREQQRVSELYSKSSSSLPSSQTRLENHYMRWTLPFTQSVLPHTSLTVPCLWRWTSNAACWSLRMPLNVRTRNPSSEEFQQVTWLSHIAGSLKVDKLHFWWSLDWTIIIFHSGPCHLLFLFFSLGLWHQPHLTGS